MGRIDFFRANVESIQVKFTCDQCGSEVISSSVFVPTPDFRAEEIRDSYTSNEDLASCPNCKKDFEIEVWGSFVDGYVLVSDIPDDSITGLDEHEFELDDYIDDQIEAYLSSKDQFGHFTNEMQKLDSLLMLEIESTSLQETMWRQIFSGGIACLEDYLSSKLTHEIFEDKETFRRFVKTFHDIRRRKFSLSEIYDQLDQIEDLVKKELYQVIYHDLPKVKGMYESSLQIDFPDIENLMILVKKRHDIVHRNGKDKEGNKIDINKEMVEEALNEIEHFIIELDSRISAKNEDEF